MGSDQKPWPCGLRCWLQRTLEAMVNRRSKLRISQGLKPPFLQALNGTAEAMPYPKPIRARRSSY
jgi:hypothetical protein